MTVLSLSLSFFLCLSLSVHFLLLEMSLLLTAVEQTTRRPLLLFVPK